MEVYLGSGHDTEKQHNCATLLLQHWYVTFMHSRAVYICFFKISTEAAARIIDRFNTRRSKDGLATVSPLISVICPLLPRVVVFDLSTTSLTTFSLARGHLCHCQRVRRQGNVPLSVWLHKIELPVIT